MASSYNQVVGTGALQTLAVPPYLDVAHIKVSIDKVDTLSFAWVNPSTISFTAPIGSQVRVYRNTSSAARLVDYVTGLGLTENTLDIDSIQAFFLAQEAADGSIEALKLDTRGRYGAAGAKITGVATATEPTDAVNLAQMTEVMGSNLQAMASAAQAALSVLQAQAFSVTSDDHAKESAAFSVLANKYANDTLTLKNSFVGVFGGLGYSPPVAYTGGLNLTLATQTVSYGGNTYAPVFSALPFITSGTFEVAKFRLLQGVSGADLSAANGVPLLAYTAFDAQRILDNSYPLTNYADMLAYNGRAIGIRITGVYVTSVPDGTVGTFQYNPTAPNTTNGGTRFAHASGVGAWERQFSGPMHSAWFKTVSGGIVDTTVAMQAFLDAAAGGAGVIAPGTYRCTASLLVRGDLSGPGATLSFVGTSMGGAVNACVYQTAQGSITGLTIDAAGVVQCRAGIWVNADFLQTRQCRYDVTIKNITNTDTTQPAYGFIVVRFSDSLIKSADFDIKANVENVQAAANGTIGDSGGAARGIGVSFNSAGCTPQIRIHDSYVNGVKSGTLPFGEDGDGIGLVQVDHAAVGAGGIYRIENCTVKDSMKRSYKIQAPSVVVDSCVSHGQCYESYTTFSPSTRFTNCKAFNSGATCVSVNGSNCVISGFYGDSTDFAPLRIYTVADNTQVSDSTFIHNAAVPVSQTARACMFAENTVSITNTVFKNSFGQGAGVRCLGTTNLKMVNCDLSGLDYGVSFDSSATGVVLIDNCAITAALDGLVRAGNSALIVNIRNSRIVAGARGLNLYASAGASAAVLRMSNCTITAGLDGVTCAEYSVITGCRIDSTTFATTGVASVSQGIAILNYTEASGNTVSLFKYNYVYTNTVKTVVVNNVSVTPVTTDYLKTGYTVFSELNNVSR
ncbi:hypothetical protein GNX71_18605 [Variovorax sp. RKNM96]|uniref:phage tail fiber domain-containing protein n=1 Tax=Variovorax sp. RKNM96 TaxID=2681552 RepID=UPI00197FAA51|nr:phage tail fiber protein [Variovorax sp. RKNM96]QSI31480.1 hypothetical protein GNX71_18605 [Variovorax sp. RKNM96]